MAAVVHSKIEDAAVSLLLHPRPFDGGGVSSVNFKFTYINLAPNSDVVKH